MASSIEDIIKDVNSSLPERKLAELLNRTSLSADMKANLITLSKVTINIGGKILMIGRKILSVAFEFVKTFPNMTFGVIIALIITSLIAAIPLFGPALAAALSSLLLLLGFAKGALNDFRSDKFDERIQRFLGSFSALATV